MAVVVVVHVMLVGPIVLVIEWVEEDGGDGDGAPGPGSKLTANSAAKVESGPMTFLTGPRIVSSKVLSSGVRSQA
ncbi:hypothetical protein [Labedaea rhizosphaerae]|uniref:hypothetical protein n=1 Tax=Labedaea rhizosphaerae TaxID=598644 RepID=UPI00105C56A5|nr:hypothetical protein [Labedaea rhizosphaerae]